MQQSGGFHIWSGFYWPVLVDVWFDCSNVFQQKKSGITDILK